MRFTLVECQIVDALAGGNLQDGMGGIAICSAIGKPSGTIHPDLVRLEKKGMVESYWQENLPTDPPDRPRRRIYRLTGHARMVRANMMAEGTWQRPNEGGEGVPVPAT